MTLELYQILGNQAFDDAFYAEMNGRLEAGEMWPQFGNSEIDEYRETGKVPIWISYSPATGISPHRQTDDSGNVGYMP